MNSKADPTKETADVFHRGRFTLVQPKGAGHRSGIDAMLLAATVPEGFDGHVADLGAGAGAAGMAVASRCPHTQVTLIERDPAMAAFARKSLDHESNQALAARLSVLESDVALTGKARRDAGLADNSFDAVIMNPPFNAAGDRQTPDAAKAVAHVMPDGMFEAWLRTAAAILKPGGIVAVITRPQSLSDILAATDGRFGGFRLTPVHPRADEAAIRLIATGIKGSRARLSLLPPLILHGAEGNGFLPTAERLINGEIGLFG